VASVPFGLERLRLPLSLGGLGIPSRVRLRLASFLSTVAKAIPTLVDKVDPNSGKVFQRGYFSSQHMESLLGVGSFDGESWDLGLFLASGVPLADATADSWQQLSLTELHTKWVAGARRRSILRCRHSPRRAAQPPPPTASSRATRPTSVRESKTSNTP
jgi:hypothetical protein